MGTEIETKVAEHEQAIEALVDVIETQQTLIKGLAKAVTLLLANLARTQGLSDEADAVLAMLQKAEAAQT